MDLHALLKKNTQALHSEIENSYFFKRIVKKTILLDEYKCLLKALYGFIKPHEVQINSQSSLSFILIDREKSPLLKSDLASLGINIDVISLYEIPKFKNIGEVLGYLYVIEGATLGGKVLTPLIQEILSINAFSSIQYFNAYGAQTRLRWQEFCTLLDGYSQNRELVTYAIDSAKSTFQKMHLWIDKAKGNYGY